jgi:hypothetical protein
MRTSVPAKSDKEKLTPRQSAPTSFTRPTHHRRRFEAIYVAWAAFDPTWE